MPERRVTVVSQAGLHARPAGLLTQVAAGSGFSVKAGREGGPRVDASSILAVMSLGIKYGEELILSCDDPGSEEVLDQLAELASQAHD